MSYETTTIDHRRAADVSPLLISCERGVNVTPLAKRGMFAVTATGRRPDRSVSILGLIVTLIAALIILAHGCHGEDVDDELFDSSIPITACQPAPLLPD